MSKKRAVLMVAGMAVMVLAFAGVAWAANIQCQGGPCMGTEQNDRITGSQQDDDIEALGGRTRSTPAGGTIL